MSERVAIVTGGNKGIGLAVVRGLSQRFQGVVYLTSRDVLRGQAALVKLHQEGLSPRYHQLDVTDRTSVMRLHDHIASTHQGIDILINNAAISDNDSPSSQLNYDTCKQIIDINYKSILTIQEVLFPLLRENARVINVSSDCGHLSNVRNEYWIKRLSSKDLSVNDINEFVDWFLESVKTGKFNPEDIADNGTVAPYRVAKVALSAVTMLQQKQLQSRNISVNSMHPGLVRTDMTGGVGFLSPDEAALTPLYLALEAPQSLKGQYVWHDRTVLDWFDYKGDYFFKYNALKQKYLINYAT